MLKVFFFFFFSNKSACDNLKSHFTSRLYLVFVKYFSENKYFPEILFSGKENIFKCLVAF